MDEFAAPVCWTTTRFDPGTRCTPAPGRRELAARTTLCPSAPSSEGRTLLLRTGRFASSAIRRWRLAPERSFSFPHPPLNYYRTLASRNGFLRPEDRTIRVLFFGRIYEYKGLRYLVEAAPIVHRAVPDARFIVAGAGTDFERYRTEIEALPYFESYNRYIPAEEGARLFAEADILVLPYIEASQSGVLMIALPFGLPVVATDVGEIGATVKAQERAPCSPKDSQALAAALIQLAKDKDLRNQLSDNAMRAMEAEFSNIVLSRRLTSIYKEVLKAHIA